MRRQNKTLSNILEYQSNVNTLRPRQNGRHFADAIFKCIFLNENIWIPIKKSLKFVPKGPINNTPSLVQIMAWRRPGDKPLSEPMMVSLTTHICVTRPQWVTGHWGFVLLSLIVTNIKDYLNCNAYLFVQHWGDFKKHIIFLSFQWCHTKIHSI